LRALAVYLVAQHHLPLGRVQQLLADLLGMRLARGALVGWVRAERRVCSSRSSGTSRRRCCKHQCCQSDETGVRRAGKLAWAHVTRRTSTSWLTHSAIHPQRGQEALEAIGILPASRGVSLHDGWGSYGRYHACRHARCTVHQPRGS
jgi:transposase